MMGMKKYKFTEMSLNMINTWFTSDTHFGHTKVIEFEKEARPFTCLEEMHEVMIDRWNSVVRDNDIVYHLGDFCFGRKNIEIAGRLKGKKRLILGNHDTYPSLDYFKYFDKLHGAHSWKGCILSHVPVHPNQLQGRFKLCVHGHLHSRVVLEYINDNEIWESSELFKGIIVKPDDRYFNVSVERNNLTPFHADEILNRLKDLEK